MTREYYLQAFSASFAGGTDKRIVLDERDALVLASTLGLALVAIGCR